MEEMPKCDHSIESFPVVLFIVYAEQGGSTFRDCGGNPSVTGIQSNRKATEQHFTVVLNNMLYKAVLTFELL